MALERRTRRVAMGAPRQHGRETPRAEWLRWAAAFAVLALLVPFVLPGGVHSRGFIPLELALAALLLLVYRGVAVRLARHARGARGEQKVGRILDGLAASGWLTLHDVAAAGGGIDHIAVGPSGVFAIETKSERGRVSAARISRRWLAQACAERERLERASGVRVHPLLVFSDADIVGQPLSRRRGVLVLSARTLASHLATRQRVLTAEQVRESYARIVTALSSPPR